MSSFVAAWVGPTVLGSTLLASAATGAIIGGGVAAASSLVSGNNIGDSLQAGLGGAVVGGIGGAIGGGISAAMGGGSTAAGYTLTGDAIADMGMLTDMGYSGAAAEGLINTGGAGAFVAGIGNGAMATDYAGASALNSAKGLLEGGKIASTGLGMLGSYLQGNAAKDAATTSALAQVEASKIAADAAKFRPVGVTSRFGASQFGTDANGNVTSAGYMLSPEMKAQQDKLMGISEGALSQYQGAQAATAPMGQAAQTMMTMGQGYLSTSPEQQAAKYMAEQQALLGTSRERELSSLENRLLQQGRLGMATGGTSTGMMAANPELEAWYNAKRQQDLGLAAQATQGGMDYAKFGAGMVGSGGDMLKGMYGTQQSAYSPYQTALGGAGYIEGLGQQAMDTGVNIGAKGTAASAQSGLLLGQGMTNAAQAMQEANQYSPWARPLGMLSNELKNYNWGT